MENKIERKWYDDNWKSIIKWNELIGRFCELVPEIEYCVYNGPTAIRYSPKNVGNYYPTAELQKQECERYVQEQEAKGYAKAGELSIGKQEWWPWFNQDWNMLMFAYLKMTQSQVIPGFWFIIKKDNVAIHSDEHGSIAIERYGDIPTLKICVYKCLAQFLGFYTSVYKKV